MQKNPFREISPELWLMLACASCDTNKIKIFLQQPVNWNLLLQLAVHHRVYPLVYKTLSQINNSAVPEYVLGLLRKKYQENAMQALSMTGETVRIVKCLENKGIYTVVLKGAPLSWHLYGDIAIRPSKDIDILVPPDELEKANGILKEEGYSRTCEYNPHNLTPRQHQIYLMHRGHSSHFEYWNSKKNINLEIHWELGNHVQAIPFPIEGNIKKIGVAGNSLPVLPDDELLLYLILHGAGHGWLRLRWLIDIAMLTQQRGVDWEKTAILANCFGMQTFLHQYFILANQLLAVPMPPNLLSAVARDRLAWCFAYMAMNMCLSEADFRIRGSNVRNIINWPIIYQFHILTGWKNRFKYVLKLFEPEIEDIKLISLPDSLYALYYGIRPFTWLGRHLRKLMAGN